MNAGLRDWSQSNLTSQIEIIIYLILSHHGSGLKLGNIHTLLMQTSVGLGLKCRKVFIYSFQTVFKLFLLRLDIMGPVQN